MAISRWANASAIVLTVLVGCVLLATAAGGQTLTIANTSLSTLEARDGLKITIGYQITSTGNTTAQLVATLTAPNSQVVGDMGDVDSYGTPYTVNVTTGTQWYYRHFIVNLPPGAQTGTSTYYTVNYTVKWGANSTSYSWPGSLKMLPPVQMRIPILMYHKVGAATYSQYWNTTTMLTNQMAALKAYGYTALTCRELMDIRAGVRTAPAKPVMLTFDGGYQNFYQYSLPIVSAQGYMPVLFQLTGYMGQDNSWDGDNNPVIMFMTNAELTACWNTGMLDIQDHTVTHPNMTTINSAQTAAELLDSRATIQACCPGAACDWMAYPYGSQNATAEQRVRDNLYFGAFAASGGVETNCVNKYALKRIEVSSSTVTDYNPSSPSRFFFNMIGANLAIPTITINSVQYLDPDTGSPVTEVQWGQTVKIRATATNSGTTASAGCSLSLSNPTNGTVYDSHATTPPEDVTVTAWSGQRTFDFFYTVPVDAPTGVQYTAKVYFRDALYVLGFKGPVSYAAFTVISNLISLQDVKTYADNTWTSIKGAIITAAFPDFFYLETPTRSLGIRVERAAHGFARGTKVDVAGQIVDSPTTGERCLVASYAISRGTGSIAPMAVTNASVGGTAFGYQDQVWGWRASDSGPQWAPTSGLNNVGLLVRTCGRVVSIDASSRVLVIDDGSGANLKCAWTDTVSIDPSWTYATLTGISSCEMVSGQRGRLLLITSAQGQ